MNGGKVIYHFEADDKALKESTLSVGKIVKGNLISSAITSGLSKVWGGIKNITSSISGMAVQGGFERALDIENAEHKLTGLGHSAEEVKGIMDNALASVKGTAYGMGDAATVAASAVAAGVKPGQDLERTLKLVGDAAAISGRDMVSMGAIFNKVASSGKMTGEELNQLTDSGIPMLQLLADNLGKTTEEVRDMVSAGEIGFDDFRNAIETGMGGAALKMGETFQGNLENTKAAMSRLGKEFMDPFLKGMTPALSTVIQIIDKITAGSTDGLDELGNQLATQLQEVITNVIDKALPMIKNAIPVITKVLEQLIKAIPPILDGLLPEVINVIMMIINSLVQLLPTLIPTLMNALIQAIQMLAQMLPQLIPPLIQGIVLIVQSLAQALPTLIPQLITAILDAILMLLDNIDLLIDCGLQLMFGLIDGIIAAIPILVEKIPEILKKMIDAIIRNFPKFIDAGLKLMLKMAEGLVKGFQSVLQKFPSFGSKMVGGLTSFIGQFGNVGKNLIKGLWNGISNVTGWIVSKIKGFGKSVLGAIKGIFGVHSPSTEFEWIGKMNMVGLEQGMESMKSKLQGTIDTMFNLQPNVSGSMQSTYSPQMTVNVQNNMELDPLGQLVNNIKTFSGGAKNDYNWGASL
jgi:tape measure domain-containing protein